MKEMEEIRMVDLQTQYYRLKPEIDEAMQSVIENSAFINGPAVKSFQNHLEQYLSIKHAIPCANGTDALQVALMALDLQPGDEVITSTFTFIATVEVIALLKLKPVLVDVDLQTFTLIPELVKSAITSKTKAIIPVHLFGQGAKMNEIMQIADQYQLFVIEDNAQALGADFEIKESKKKLGTIGHISCTSFFPSKNLGCFGDGGACFTDNDRLAEKMRMITNHGSQKKYYHQIIGINSRLDTLQAAVLNVKLKHLDDFIARRQRAADFYNNTLRQLSSVIIPAQSNQSTHTFHQYTLRITNGKRDALKKHLEERQIPSMVYYPLPLHQQEAFAPFMDRKLTLANAELLSQEVLSLPMHTELTIEQLTYIAQTLISFFND